MDLESVRIFVKVAEVANFTRAAEHLGMPKSRVSLRVRALEEELGGQLLQRTTRTVKLTPDGEQFLARARRLVVEADDLASMFLAPSNLRGRVRIDLPINVARSVIIPRLPEFIAQHPNLELMVSTTDRRVDLLREGFDCVLRIGSLRDSSLMAKRLGMLSMMNLVSPGYVRKYGIPRDLDDLDRHFLVHYSSSFGADEPTFEYPDGQGYRERPMRALVTVNNADAYEAACLAGLGIIQAPRWGRANALQSGHLIEVLPEYRCAPMPVSLVHAHGRNVPKRVRAVMSWIGQLLEPLFG